MCQNRGTTEEMFLTRTGINRYSEGAFVKRLSGPEKAARRAVCRVFPYPKLEKTDVSVAGSGTVSLGSH